MYPSSAAIRFQPLYLTKSIDWHGHLNFVFSLIEVCKPRKIIELGVFRGDSLSAISQACRELGLTNTEVVGVDTWAGDITTGTYGEEVYDVVKDHFDTTYPSTILIRSLFSEALAKVDDSTVDILHIDGLHTYDAVTEDFTTWLPKLSVSGVVLFHDISVMNADFGVYKFWSEVKDSYPSFSFDHSNGLGVLLVGPKQEPQLLDLVSSPNQLDQCKAIFESSSSRLILLAKLKWQISENQELSRSVNSLQSSLVNLKASHSAVSNSPSPSASNPNLIGRVYRKFF